MSFPSFSAGEVLTAADMNAVGLWLIKTQTIGTSVSSVTVSDAFSSTYDNYKIVISGVGMGGSGNSLFMTLPNSTGATYRFNGNFMNYSAATVNGAFGIHANGLWLGVSSDRFSTSFDICRPFVNSYTNSFGHSSSTDFSTDFRNLDTNNASHTSFTLVQTGYTMTGGTIRVYGYRN
jgi:hypothetical protein